MDTLLIPPGWHFDDERDDAVSVRAATTEGGSGVGMSLPDGWDGVWFNRANAARLRDWLDQFLAETADDAPLAAGDRVEYAADGPNKNLRGKHGTVRFLDGGRGAPSAIAGVQFDGHAATWHVRPAHLTAIEEA